uniref:CUB domain-containing protein n=1 Tax=Glossina palpalis gambiensis TaxID=67801 RepID=A0A1B0ANQ9_9MUSC
MFIVACHQLVLFDLIVLFSLAAINSSNVESSSWKDFFFGNGWKSFSSNRDARILPIFTLIPVGLTLCSAPSGEYGNCLPSKDCALRGGIPAGPCGGGYVLQTCGGIVRENSTYFVNPNHPDTYDGTGSCQVTVQKLHPDICQLRLDLDMFSIAQPESTNHLCTQDQLLISGSSPVPTICGSSSGDHMYVDAGLGQSNPIVISIITSGTFPRIWRIRVTQIHCGSINRADQGCLQYYTNISGRVKSFNFNTVSGRQLSNQDYSVCIRTERNFCGIQYNACPDLENNPPRSFTISGNSNEEVGTMVGGGTQMIEDACIQDWLLVGCMRSADRIPPISACEDRVCGGIFSAEVGMVQKTVQTPTDVDNRGFCLDFVQQPCTNGF